MRLYSKHAPLCFSNYSTSVLYRHYFWLRFWASVLQMKLLQLLQKHQNLWQSSAGATVDRGAMAMDTDMDVTTDTGMDGVDMVIPMVTTEATVLMATTEVCGVMENWLKLLQLCLPRLTCPLIGNETGKLTYTRRIESYITFTLTWPINLLNPINHLHAMIFFIYHLILWTVMVIWPDHHNVKANWTSRGENSESLTSHPYNRKQ